MTERKSLSALSADVGRVPAIPMRGEAAPPVPEAPDLDDALLGRWRWSLSAMARKAVAAQERAQVAVTAWERLVADARTAGIPERLVVAAAADAGLDVPGSE
jgi:hypothetical protein